MGANDVASFLIAGPQGHVLIDGGYPGTAPMIMASIAELGFDIRDVRVLLNSEPHFDHAGGLAYPVARVQHRVRDGDTVRVGPTAVAAHITGGHARGCTSWSFPVRDGERVLNVVSACSLVMMGGMRYPEQRADFEHTFRVLRSLRADIWVSSHARLFGRYRKFVARATAKHPADSFIDPEGYRAYIDSGEARLRRGVVQ